MQSLFHIIATPRGEGSRTLKVSRFFLDSFKGSHSDWYIDELGLFEEDLPELSVERVNGKYKLMAGEKLSGGLKESWRVIEGHIQRFLKADIYLLSTPMWNFSIPYILKHYIDIIVQPGYLFRYTDKGPEGLLKNKKMVVISSRGGDYSQGSPFHAYDKQEDYLRTVFGFCGIKDIEFIYVQPMDAMGPEVMNERISSAKDTALKMAAKI